MVFRKKLQLRIFRIKIINFELKIFEVENFKIEKLQTYYKCSKIRISGTANIEIKIVKNNSLNS